VPLKLPERFAAESRSSRLCTAGSGFAVICRISRRRLSRLLASSEVPCLYPVETFEDGAALLRQCEAMGLEAICSLVKILE
jgi:hypothetical protein